MTTATTITTSEKILANMILVSIIALFIYGAYLAGSWLIERDAARWRSLKEDCVARGGYIVEHIGGMTIFDCVNPKTIK